MAKRVVVCIVFAEGTLQLQRENDRSKQPIADNSFFDLIKDTGIPVLITGLFEVIKTFIFYYYSEQQGLFKAT